MKSYLLTVQTLTPLLLSERQTTQTGTSLDYIPGSTLLGGLAGAYLRRRGLPPDAVDADFERFFLQDQICCGNLYPANFASFQTGAAPVKPLPHTARSCKRWPGFMPSVDSQERHGVLDHLSLWALFKLSNNPKVFEQSRYCGECRTAGITERLAPFAGYYQRFGDGQYERSSLNRRLVTGTGVNRRTGTVQEEILFSYEVLAELTAERRPQQFQGLLRIDETVAGDFEPFLTEVAADLRVGRAKTRGFGRLQCAAPVPLNPAGAEQFAARLTAFDDHLKTTAADYHVALESGFYFAVTCCSDLILRTPDLRYRTSLDADALAGELELPDPAALRLIYQQASTERTSGWNALWRLPKPVELAVSKGSVFLFAYTGESQTELISKLHALEQRGIGSRQAEGFGRVSVSDEFHQELCMPKLKFRHPHG